MSVRREQDFGVLKARPDPELVRSLTEQRIEAPNKMERRHSGFSRDVRYRQRPFPHFTEKLTRSAQPAKNIWWQQHSKRSV